MFTTRENISVCVYDFIKYYNYKIDDNIVKDFDNQFNISLDNLCYIYRDTLNIKIKKVLYNLILFKNPDSDILNNLIIHSRTEKSNIIATERLLSCYTNKEQLISILYFSLPKYKKQALSFLLKSDYIFDENDIVHILCYGRSSLSKNNIKYLHNLLCKILGVDLKSIDEKQLIRKISNVVVNEPSSFEQESYHSLCNTTHCLAGFSTLLDPIAKDIEKSHSTLMAGCVTLPNYSKHFFNLNTQSVFNILKKIDEKYNKSTLNQ